jgi:hypothetical protein
MSSRGGPVASWLSYFAAYLVAPLLLALAVAVVLLVAGWCLPLVVAVVFPAAGLLLCSLPPESSLRSRHPSFRSLPVSIRCSCLYQVLSLLVYFKFD